MSGECLGHVAGQDCRAGQDRRAARSNSLVIAWKDVDSDGPTLE